MALALLGVATVVLALPRPLSPVLLAVAMPLAAALAVSGTILGWSAGLGAPVLDALLHGRPVGAVAWRGIGIGAASGFALGAVVLLNGLGGLVFGIVYVRRGIEAAMLAHFSADVVLHVIGPGLAGARAVLPA